MLRYQEIVRSAKWYTFFEMNDAARASLGTGVWGKYLNCA